MKSVPRVCWILWLHVCAVSENVKSDLLSKCYTNLYIMYPVERAIFQAHRAVLGSLRYCLEDIFQFKHMDQ